MQFSLQMCSLVLMALASASVALPASQANSQWEFKGYDQTGNRGKESSIQGSGSGCHDFDQSVNSFDWNCPGDHCTFTLYSGKQCTDSDVYHGPSNSQKGDLSINEHKIFSIKIECK